MVVKSWQVQQHESLSRPRHVTTAKQTLRQQGKFESSRESDAGPTFSRRSLYLAFASIPCVLPLPSTAKIECAPYPSKLQVQEVVDRLRKCFEEGQYYVSGNLDRGIFEPDCVFTDPTINVKGTEKYAKAVSEIFSPKTSQADLISLQITGSDKIELEWRLAGVITQGGIDFKFKPYLGSTVYTLDECSGKIRRQDETWKISTLDVFISIFFPSFGAPPAPPADELRLRK